MKKVLLLCLCLVLFPSLLMALTSDEKRRVEEEKRESLQPSEIQMVREKEPVLPQISPIDLVYFTELMPRRVTFCYDACRALVILMGVEEQYLDLDSQVTFLKDKNLLPKKYETEFNPMEPLRKGLFAYMFCKALKIKGGVTLRFFGMSQRYCLKELAFEGVMPSGNIKDTVSGEELVSAIIQATDYLARKNGSTPLKLKEQE